MDCGVVCFAKVYRVIGRFKAFPAPLVVWKNTWFGSTQYSLLQIITERISKRFTGNFSGQQIACDRSDSGFTGPEFFFHLNIIFTLFFQIWWWRRSWFFDKIGNHPVMRVPAIHATQDCPSERKRRPKPAEPKLAFSLGDVFRDCSCVSV